MVEIDPYHLYSRLGKLLYEEYLGNLTLWWLLDKIQQDIWFNEDDSIVFLASHYCEVICSILEERNSK